ncbi:MAG: YceI family protein [Candidatus Competibacterales bacterium]|nr:YceI family protein [Candidatus Competibacterales bacterium]
MRNVLLFATLSALPLASAQAADSYTVDPAHTYGHFAISHLGFSTMFGRIHSTGGNFMVDLDNMTGSVQVELDPASIDTGHQKRDDHLRSPDFLNVVEFPEMRFESTAVNLTENGGTVEGELTLHGQTQPVTLEITAWHCGTHPINKKEACGFDATGKLKRSDFGISYGLPAIGDDMTLYLELEGLKEES